MPIIVLKTIILHTVPASERIAKWEQTVHARSAVYLVVTVTVLCYQLNPLETKCAFQIAQPLYHCDSTTAMWQYHCQQELLPVLTVHWCSNTRTLCSPHGHCQHDPPSWNFNITFICGLPLWSLSPVTFVMPNYAKKYITLHVLDPKLNLTF